MPKTVIEQLREARALIENIEATVFGAPATATAPATPARRRGRPPTAEVAAPTQPTTVAAKRPVDYVRMIRSRPSGMTLAQIASHTQRTPGLVSAHLKPWLAKGILRQDGERFFAVAAAPAEEGRAAA